MISTIPFGESLVKVIASLLHQTLAVLCVLLVVPALHREDLRHVPLEGQPNFRDVEGDTTIDGKTVWCGLVSRSGETLASSGKSGRSLERHDGRVPNRSFVGARRSPAFRPADGRQTRRGSALLENGKATVFEYENHRRH